jgi:hypothetical protein
MTVPAIRSRQDWWATRLKRPNGSHLDKHWFLSAESLVSHKRSLGSELRSRALPGVPLELQRRYLALLMEKNCRHTAAGAVPSGQPGFAEHVGDAVLPEVIVERAPRVGLGKSLPRALVPMLRRADHAGPGDLSP